jgi:hypothetical protein
MVDVFGILCSKLQFELCRVSCTLYIAILRAFYLLNNELGGGGGWREPGQAGKTCLFVSVNHFTLCFTLIEHAVYHVCSILNSVSYYY